MCWECFVTCSQVEQGWDEIEPAGPPPHVHHEVDPVGLVQGPAVLVEIVRVPSSVSVQKKKNRNTYIYDQARSNMIYFFYVQLNNLSLNPSK